MSKYETEYEGWEYINGGWAQGYEDVVTDTESYDEIYFSSHDEEPGECSKCGTLLWQDESIRTGLCGDCRAK